MRNFSTLGLVMGSIFIIISGGCADKPLPIQPGTGSPLEQGNGSITSGSASGSGSGSNEGFNVPEDSDFSRSGIQESGVGRGSNTASNNSNTGPGSSSSKDDFRGGELKADSSVDNPESLKGGDGSLKLFGDVPFHTTSDLTDIFFEYDKHDLSDQSKSILNKNASWLKNNPTVQVQIQGHCDERGTNNYNMALGQRRAQSTKNFLISLGVSNRIVAESYGEEKPFCVASNEDCWSQNRRGHFMVTR